MRFLRLIGGRCLLVVGSFGWGIRWNVLGRRPFVGGLKPLPSLWSPTPKTAIKDCQMTWSSYAKSVPKRFTLLAESPKWQPYCLFLVGVKACFSPLNSIFDEQDVSLSFSAPLVDSISDYPSNSLTPTLCRNPIHSTLSAPFFLPTRALTQA